MQCSKGLTKTIILKSPDSDKVREVIVTSVLLPKNENNRSPIKMYRSCEDMEFGVERRMCKRRLDHLTLEEKILRKKLKNREAAQTSRDRKKARLQELETSVLELQNENEVLHEEVRSLKDDKETLQRENARLTEEVWRLSVGCGRAASGPAVSPPPPQGARPPPALPPTLLPLLTLLSAWTTGRGWTTSPSALPSSKSWSTSQILSLLKPIIQKQKHRKKIWWGRKQQAWNPVGHV